MVLHINCIISYSCAAIVLLIISTTVVATQYADSEQKRENELSEIKMPGGYPVNPDSMPEMKIPGGILINQNPYPKMKPSGYPVNPDSMPEMKIPGGILINQNPYPKMKPSGYPVNPDPMPEMKIPGGISINQNPYPKMKPSGYPVNPDPMPEMKIPGGIQNNADPNAYPEMKPSFYPSTTKVTDSAELKRGGVIEVTEATYGWNCRDFNPWQGKINTVKRNNALADISTRCNGRKECNYTVYYKHIGDPAFGCEKDYSVTYLCTLNREEHKEYVSAEAGWGPERKSQTKTIRLYCN